jgi:hypothetical protein
MITTRKPLEPLPVDTDEEHLIFGEDDYAEVIERTVRGMPPIDINYVEFEE